jgi:hypothetical protein
MGFYSYGSRESYPRASCAAGRDMGKFYSHLIEKQLNVHERMESNLSWCTFAERCWARAIVKISSRSKQAQGYILWSDR